MPNTKSSTKKTKTSSRRFMPFRQSINRTRGLMFILAFALMGVGYLLYSQASPAYSVRFVLFCSQNQCSGNLGSLQGYANQAQSWYQGQVGKTFQIASVEVVYGSHPSSFYANTGGYGASGNTATNIASEIGQANVKTVVLLGFPSMTNWGIAATHDNDVNDTAVADPFRINNAGLNSAVLAHELGHTLLWNTPDPYKGSSDHTSDGTLMNAPAACSSHPLSSCVLNRTQAGLIANSPYMSGSASTPIPSGGNPAPAPPTHPATVSWAPGRIDNFVKGTDSQLWHQWYAGSWSGWERLDAPPGGLASSPTVASWSAGRLDVFAKGADNQLWHKWYAGGWSGWEALGGTLASDPAAVSWASGRIDVFAKGTDNQMWHKWYAGGWSGWEGLGGTLTGAPAVASWAPGRLDVFVKGTDSQLWHKWYAGGWSNGWEGLGGALASDPGTVSWSAGRIDVFIKGTDNQMWHKWYDGGWSGWEGLGGTLTSAPAVASWAPGRLDVFVRGTDSQLWHMWYAGGWSGWEGLGGAF